MARALSCLECAEAYESLTSRNAADDARFAFLEGVYWWRFERYQRDAVANLRRCLKTAPPLRVQGGEHDWWGKLDHAKNAFAAHAQLHAHYQHTLNVIAAFEAGQIAFSDAEKAELLKRCEKGMGIVPRAKKMPMHFFLMAAKARWAVMGRGDPTPAPMALLAGAVGFDTITNRAAARERWKERIHSWRRASPRAEALALARIDASLDGSGCFEISRTNSTPEGRRALAG